MAAIAPKRSRKVSKNSNYSYDSSDMSDDEISLDYHTKDISRSDFSNDDCNLMQESSTGSRMSCRKRFSTSPDDLKILKKRDYQTRKPECFNRGAVMARQNRMKKKMYVENLEDEVSYLKKENSQLKYVLRKQSGMVKKLRREEDYLRSVIENRTEIGALVKHLRMPIENKVTNCVRPSAIAKKTAHSFNEATDSRFSIPAYAETDPLISNLNFDNELCEIPDIDTIFDDNLLSAFSFPTPEQLPEDIFSTLPESFPEFSTNTVCPELTHVSEHSYSKHDSKQTTGVCIHVADGKISLEFCGTCHKHATNKIEDSSLTTRCDSDVSEEENE